ncbi:hypothetical protein [Azorhizobium doebereinerae]|uniref:hypothetical protein n=1 Tax=Azorhizobium doebereinerae TaxID=281091 RepID=UPI0003FE302F|nr:hypothetical protein [Azorhizobium doebereinerae]
MTDATGYVRWGAILGWVARFALLGTGLALAGCQTDGTGVASNGGSASRALAFESIDGPPKDTFDRLVTRLATEAETKQVAVVSRAQPANYRIRGYLSVHTEKGKTMVAYAWDVFDADKQRVARITGEETTKSVKGGAWAACDEQMLTRIANTTIASLSETLSVGATGAAGATAAAAPAGPAEVSAPVAQQPADPAPAAAPGPGPLDNGGVPVASAAPFGAASADTSALAYASR